MKTSNSLVLAPVISRFTHSIRGQRVILNGDLGCLYDTPTRVLNRAVKRNTRHFASDLLFQPPPEEMAAIRSQFVIASDRSQIVTDPFTFTEHDAPMAANILDSSRASLPRGVYLRITPPSNAGWRS